MAITLTIVSRGSGGLTVTRNSTAFQLSAGELKYQGYGAKVNVWAEEKEGQVYDGLLLDENSSMITNLEDVTTDKIEVLTVDEAANF